VALAVTRGLVEVFKRNAWVGGNRLPESALTRLGGLTAVRETLEAIRPFRVGPGHLFELHLELSEKKQFFCVKFSFWALKTASYRNAPNMAGGRERQLALAFLQA